MISICILFFQVSEKRLKKVTETNIANSCNGTSLGRTQLQTHKSTGPCIGNGNVVQSLDPWIYISPRWHPITSLAHGSCIFSMFFLFSFLQGSTSLILLKIEGETSPPVELTIMYMLQVSKNEITHVARYRRIYTHAHDYHINSISTNR